jgi:NAD(P) transhydrogenase
VSKEITVADLTFCAQKVLGREVEVVRAQLNRNHVATLSGTARFLDANTLEVESVGGTTRVRGDRILIACGTRPAHSPTVPLDGKRIVGTPTSSSGRGS